MAINWYPGHMHKAQKEIKQALPQVDVVIELLDARIPFSSENPMLNHLCAQTPRIKVLNKSDLADSVMTTEWVEYFNQQNHLAALPLTTQEPEAFKRLLTLCREHCFKLQPERNKDIRAMVMGIPNVGKSTLINLLTGRSIAKVGNEPAVTRHQQRINLHNGIILSDTPGVLWPKLEPETCGYRLAITGAVKSVAMSFEESAFFAIAYLKHAYPTRLQERYDFNQWDAAEISNMGDLELIEAIGQRRGCLRSGGQVDLNKVSTIVLNDIRQKMLGTLTFETPAMMEAEKAALLKKQAQKEQDKAEKKKKYKAQRSS